MRDELTDKDQAKVWGELSEHKPDDINGLMLNRAMVELILLNNFKNDSEDNDGVNG